MANITKEPNATNSTHTLHASNLLVLSQTHTIQVFADNSVYDTVSKKYLVEGKDFSGANIFRNG